MLSTKLAFEKAVDAFRKNNELESAEIDDFQITTLQDLKRVISSIQENQARNRKLMYMKRLDPFLKSMEDYGKVLEVFLNVSDFVAFIWGPMKYLLLVASTFSEALNSLLDAYQQIGEQIPQFIQYQELFATNPNMGTFLAMIFQDILDFHREALKYFKQRMWRKLFQATWRGFNANIESLKNKMQQHKSLLESQVTIAVFEEMKQSRIIAETAFQYSRDADMDRRRSKVIQWLSPASSQASQDACERAREGYPKTGKWFIRDRRFQKWFHPDFCSHPLLWLSGIPGAGKSVLASLVVEEAQKLPNATVAFFYSKYGDDSRNSFISVARGILSQLVNSHRTNYSLLLYMDEKASICGEPVLTSSKLAKELLDTALKSFKNVYLILDGLDECPREERKEISSWFRTVVDGLPRDDMDAIRCMFVSQDDGVARKDLSMVPSIKLTAEESKSDILAFANVFQQRIEDKLGPLDPSERNVAEIITARSQGMFIFAKLVLLNLYEQPTVKSFREEMQPDRFPQKLNDAYERILDRIVDTTTTGRREKAMKLLGWVACAKRPLKWYEIQGAESIDLENQEVNFRERMYRENSKDLCASLVEIRSDDSIELVHSTARDHLIQSHHINPEQVEYDLALLGISYLSFHALESQIPVSEMERNVLRGVFSFYEYAVSTWALHLEIGIKAATTNEILEQLAETIDVFLDGHFNDSLKGYQASKTLQDLLHPLSEYDCHKRLTQAMISFRKQLGRHGQCLLDDDVLDSSIVTTKFRTALENLASSSPDYTRKESLKQYYGPNLYKCSRMNCQYFYKGFGLEEHRNEHVARHDRAFLCVFKGCPTTTFGCATAKELQQHMYNYHGIDVPNDLEFPEVSVTKKAPIHSYKFECDLCDKKFTRNHNLVNHKRTHTNEKPCVCEECGMAFVRQNDLKRHQRIHTGEKDFVCGGSFDSGEKWGCGSAFPRVDKLNDHYKTAAGIRCRERLLEEEAAVRRKLQEEKANQQRQVTEELLARSLLQEETIQPREEDDESLCGIHADEQANSRFLQRLQEAVEFAAATPVTPKVW